MIVNRVKLERVFIFIRFIARSVIKRPTDSTTSTTGGQTATTSGQASTTSGQTDTTSGQTSTTSGQTSTTSGQTSTTSTSILLHPKFQLPRLLNSF